MKLLLITLFTFSISAIAGDLCGNLTKIMVHPVESPEPVEAVVIVNTKDGQTYIPNASTKLCGFCVQNTIASGLNNIIEEIAKSNSHSKVCLSGTGITSSVVTKDGEKLYLLDFKTVEAAE